LVLVFGAAADAGAQEFQARLVRLVVPYPGGGGVDGLSRALAERLGKVWGQTVIVENKPGASTMIGGAEVARAPADGHTLFFTTDSSITSNPHLFKSLSYDPVRDLVPVTQLINLVQLVVAHPALGASSIAELVTLARVKGSILNYASYGIGSQPHLLFEMLKKQTGIGIEQIPFKGIAPAVTAVIAGETQLTLAGSALVAGHLKSGRLKPLAVAGKTRQPSRASLMWLRCRSMGFP